jgi:hypothetical protein
MNDTGAPGPGGRRAPVECVERKRACRTIEGHEAMHAIHKGQVRWVAKSGPVAQRQFIHTVFGIAE